jgi:nicotinamide mononucleotide transporter
MQEIIQQFITGIKQTTALEYIAVIAGIVSVWLSKKENILVYPLGLVNTTIYIYLSFQYHLIGEASVNLYYTIMSIYGWALWAKRNPNQDPVLHISFSDKKQQLQQLLFFGAFYVTIYTALYFLKKSFYEGAIPWADAFASATAFTGMWLMAKKRVESWWWWIATNIASIPLYFVKGLVFTSVYYGVLLVLAVLGLIEWRRRASSNRREQKIEVEKA